MPPDELDHARYGAVNVVRVVFFSLPIRSLVLGRINGIRGALFNCYLPGYTLIKGSTQGNRIKIQMTLS